MKPFNYLVGIAVIAALSACNSKQENAASNAPLNIAPVKPPPGGDWTQVVSQTPAGGFMMGNPKATVKLVEFGSLTCDECKAFDDTGVPFLVDKYVKTGLVSWEFRNYVRDALDLTAALVVRCNGARSFFPLMRALYKDQPNWLAKVQAAPQDQLSALSTLPPNQQFVQSAKIAGLPQWAAVRGLPVAKSEQCLANEASINQLVQMASDITTQYPEFRGTPTFVINGTMVTDASRWAGLEPKLREALK